MLYLNLVYKYNYTDCKEWFMNGNTTSGVYTINPDEGTPFEVSVSIITLNYSLIFYVGLL